MGKINKEKVLEEKGELKQYTLFYEHRSEKLDWLLDVYKQDPYKARVLFYNTGTRSYWVNRFVCFERTDGSFEICNFHRKFGISRTNRIYSREIKVSSLIYKNKKFYYKTGSSLKHATYYDVKKSFNYAKDFLLEKFPWLRNIDENEMCHTISLTTIVTNKLFNADKVLKHIYKVPTPVIKVLSTTNTQEYSSRYLPKREWIRMKPYLINIENLKSEFIRNHLFQDSIEMAIKLDRKINCSWSLKRLKAEHDAWAKEIRKIALEFEPIIQLNPHRIFEDFENFTGYKMLRTNHELIEEGHKQDHCVAGYSYYVKIGRSGIYQVSGYTLEVIYDYKYLLSSDDKTVNHKTLFYSQLKGYQNCSAPQELDDTVKSYIEAFNAKYDFKEYEEYLNQDKYGVKAVVEEIENRNALLF